MNRSTMNADVAQKLARLRDILDEAVPAAQDVLDAVRAIDGDYEHLIFWPVVPPTPNRQTSEHSAWVERVNRFLIAAGAGK